MARKFERLAASKTFVGSVLILLLVYMMYSSTRGILLYDEGLICYGAERVLGGDLPYRDFWTVYGPGQYYLLAGIFKVFGTSLLVARRYCVSVEWIVAILAYAVSRRLAGPVGGLVSSVIVAVWLNWDRAVLYPAIPTLAFVLGGFLCLAHSSSIPKNLILAGLLTGCATLVRHDLGVYAFVVQSVFIVGQSFVGPTTGREKPFFRAAGVLKRFFIYALSASAVVLPVFLAFTRAVPRQILYETFVDLPFRVYPQFRSLPFPRPQDFGLIYGLPLLMLSASTVLLLTRWQRHRSRNAENWLAAGALLLGAALFLSLHVLPGTMYLLLILGASAVLLPAIRLGHQPRNAEDWLAAGLVLFGVAVFLTVRVRPDIPHMVVPMVPTLILLPWFVKVISSSGTIRLAYISSSILPLMCAGILFFNCTRKDVLPGLNGDAASFLPIGIDRARGISKTNNNDGFVQAVRYIQEKTQAGEAIYVGNTRHDELSINNVMFYFLSGHRSAARLMDLQPGIATTYKGQSEIIADLKRREVTYVVLWNAPRSTEPNRSSESSGVTTLDDFIKANYEQIAGFGEYVILHSSGSRDTLGRNVLGNGTE